MLFTSNRDEKHARPKAEFPVSIKTVNNVLYFPQDTQAMGTWFVTDQKGNVAILLNGAFENHKRKDAYSQSRGVVLLSLFKEKDIMKAFEQYNMIM